MDHRQLSYYRFSGRKLLLVFLPAVLLFSLVSVSIAQDDANDPEDAVALFNQGQEAHEKGDLAGAIKLYEKALEIIPEFPEAELQRGSAFLSLGKIDDAERSFRRAAELREDWTLALASLGAILVRKEKFAEAEQVLLRSIELDALNFPAYTALAELRLRTGAKPGVLTELLGKIKVLTAKAKPTSAIWASRGSIEKALGDTASAKASIDKALLIDPKNRVALLDRADIAITEGDVARAAEISNLVTMLTPGSTDASLLKAKVLIAQDRSDEASKILASIVPPTPEVSTLRDRIAANGTVNIGELEARLEKDPKNVAVMGRLCSVLRAQAPTKAIEYCKRAFEADQSNIGYAVGYGAALVQAKYYAPSVDLFRNILKVAPDNFTAHTNLATALFQLKRLPEAKVEYQWLIEKQPDLTIAYYLLGITHDQLGEYMDAMANYQIFLKKADPAASGLEIEKVNLRLPALQKLIKDKKGKH